MSLSGKKAGHRLARLLSGATNMPLVCMTKLPVLTCLGTVEIQAEGCQGVLEYSDDRIQLDMGGELLTVIGEELRMEEFRARCLTIHGQIRQMNWEAAHV